MSEYAIFYPEEGRYSSPLSLREAKQIVRQFLWASIVNLKTGEVLD